MKILRAASLGSSFFGSCKKSVIIHIITKRNDSVNIILSCYVPYMIECFVKFVTIRVSKYSKASCKIKKSVID